MIFFNLFVLIGLVLGAAEDCALEGISPVITSLYCNVEMGMYKIAQESPAITKAGCLLGSDPAMCSQARKVPTSSTVGASPPPPEAKNKMYQKLAEAAERALPSTWFRKGFSHDSLFLSSKEQQPKVQLGDRPLRYKKLRNIYQCATRQIFVRKAFNVSGAATGLYRHGAKMMDITQRAGATCAALENSAVQHFLERWHKEGGSGGLWGGNMVGSRWTSTSSEGDETEDAASMSLVDLSTEVLNYFLSSPAAGIWQGCFRLSGSPECRAILSAAALVNAAHLVPRLTTSDFTQPAELVSGYMLASLGRHMLHGATESTAKVRGAWLLGLRLSDFIVLQQVYLKLYMESFGALYTRQLAQHTPLSFPLFSPSDAFAQSEPAFASAALSRGKPWPAMLLENKVLLEPVFSTVRNWMFAEAQNLIDFGPYRPLPANPEARALLMGARRSARRVLVDVGANGFFASPKYLLDSYEPFAPFTDAFMVEPEEHFKAEIPQAYKQAYNITHLQIYAEVNTGRSNDMLALLPSLVTPEDFVVLKFDVDPNRFAQGPTMEWGFLFALYNNPQVAHLVDELYIELHFHYPQLSWWHYHSNWEALDAIRYLRKQGIVVHAWP